MHLASTECYIVLGGEGILQTLTLNSYKETPLHHGAVAWFTPGTIHRAISTADLQVLVLMQNAGLPEAGDAVLTFPTEILTDPTKYARAAVIDQSREEPENTAAAAARRDLAVEGYLPLREAYVAGNRTPLEDFYAHAAGIVQERARGWSELHRSTVIAQSQKTAGQIEALTQRDFAHLKDADVFTDHGSPPPRRFGMCGRLRTYDLT